MSSENWRWNTGRHLRPTNASISVIEEPDAAAKEREERTGQRVPFGFARAQEPTPDAEPLTWEGDYT